MQNFTQECRRSKPASCLKAQAYSQLRQATQLSGSMVTMRIGSAPLAAEAERGRASRRCSPANGSPSRNSSFR
jgi:hypothetical protein